MIGAAETELWVERRAEIDRAEDWETLHSLADTHARVTVNYLLGVAGFTKDAATARRHAALSARARQKLRALAAETLGVDTSAPGGTLEQSPAGSGPVTLREEGTQPPLHGG